MKKKSRVTPRGFGLDKCIVCAAGQTGKGTCCRREIEGSIYNL